MIYGNILYPEQYDFLNKSFQLCFDFIKNNDLSTMELKTYELDGNNVFCSLAEFTTVPASEKDFEAHKRYCDIHYIVKGQEQIEVGITSEMKAGEYKPDIMFLTGEGAGIIQLKAGDFMICFPEDAHKPGLSTKECALVRKALFKVLVS